MKSTFIAVFCVPIVIAACTSEPPGIELTLPEGVVETGLDSSDTGRVEEDRAQYDLGNGLRLAAQWFPASTRGVGERTARTTASAIAQRVELGEREGELIHHPCRAGDHQAECIQGSTTLGGMSYARSGFVTQVGASIVWIDVSGPASASERVAETASRLRSRFRLRPEGGT